MIGGIWLAFKALGLWGRVRRAAGAGWMAAMRYPCAAALAICAALLTLCWHVIDVKDRAVSRLIAENAQLKSAQIEAGRIAADALNHQEAVYRAKANEAENVFKSQLAGAHTAADAYIASHRMRATDAARGASTAAAGTTNSGPAIPEPLSANPVLVSAGDVQACTDAVSYAIAAHDWASTVNPQRHDDR